MKIAFCTNDLKTIDEHFGRSTQVAIYDIDDTSYMLSEVRDFEAIDGTKEHKLDTESKAKKLEDCAILYMTEIGGPAAAAVVRHKIHPVKVNEPTDIEEVLTNLKTTLAGTPPPWLRKAMINN